MGIDIIVSTLMAVIGVIFLGTDKINELLST
jgi:hypothetical protein